MLALPQPDASCIPPLPVLAPVPCHGRKRRDDIFKVAQAVTVGIVPDGIQDHGGSEQLRPRQPALSALQRPTIIGQTPAHVEWLAKDHGFVAGQDRLKAQLT